MIEEALHPLAKAHRVERGIAVDLWRDGLEIGTQLLAADQTAIEELSDVVPVLPVAAHRDEVDG
ncbi:hypothetical protein BH18ACI5_BH18ACI5_04040 [soil metagenome]